MTALLLCKEFNIDSTSTAQTENNSVAYLASWIESGALTKEDFKIAVQEANRSAKAIFAEAPEIKLSQDIGFITPENIKNYLTEDNKNKIKDLAGMSMLYNHAYLEYVASQNPNDLKDNSYIQAQRQVKNPDELLKSAVDKLNQLQTELKKQNIELTPLSKKIPTKQIHYQGLKM